MTQNLDALSTDTPTDYESLKARIGVLSDNMPKRLLQCAKYALANPDRIALGTTAEIASAAGVQPSTLVRFAQTLGFDGFSQMQQIFQGQLVGRSNEYTERLNKIHESGTNTPASILGNFIASSKQSLDELLMQVDTIALDKTIEALATAETIHLLGLRRAFPVVSYLHYTLGKMRVRTNLLEFTGGILEERVQFINENDALFVATFSPYSPEVVEFASKAFGRGVKVLSLTDSVLSPIARVSSTVLEVHEAEHGAFRSLSTTMCLATSLAVAVGDARKWTSLS
ncbi:RpiR family transcriptional regulator [Pseudovibrio japonicus]|uniref:RpiR family transcriptional regulator n=1 Tax=Pseudovibrio japonicus TaxID=366534 RepID=A0ABQ3DYX0_9HYPH|nr:MurR/RpiR family transcriptional regulator [Pseudovibrio japonicus]GHB20227.1 RpiR family transcriptional regulator [Pseudovibrio japonicus]